VTTPPAATTGIFDQASSSASLKQGQGVNPSAPTPPRAYTPPAGEFTRVFGDPSTEIPTQGPMMPMPAPGAPPPAPASAPGEYTRMFSAPSISQEPIAAPVQSTISAPEITVPAKKSSMLIPVLIGAILLLLAAIAVIVAMMGK
jgi:hypothetical protein